MPVPERYQGGACRIEDTAKRGLTLEMLEGLFILTKDVLDAGYKIVDNVSGEEVTIDTMNLYHVDEHFVKPLTKKDSVPLWNSRPPRKQSVNPSSLSVTGGAPH